MGESILVCHKSKSILQICGENKNNDNETDDARKLFVTCHNTYCIFRAKRSYFNTFTIVSFM